MTRREPRAESSFSTVVIDPGHGGFDRGGIPGQIVPEKMVALDTALRLQKLLQRAGLRTVMTRTTDVFIPLSVRSAIANSQPDAIFVSIHYNAAPRSGAHGIETYSENNRGAVLAARIQRDIVTRVSTENRGIRSAEYYVLRNCRLPAVLVECGFLTNPVEAQLALTPAIGNKSQNRSRRESSSNGKLHFLRSFRRIGALGAQEQETSKSRSLGTACFPGTRFPIAKEN